MSDTQFKETLIKNKFVVPSFPRSLVRAQLRLGL